MSTAIVLADPIGYRARMAEDAWRNRERIPILVLDEDGDRVLFAATEIEARCGRDARPADRTEAL